MAGHRCFMAAPTSGTCSGCAPPGPRDSAPSVLGDRRRLRSVHSDRSAREKHEALVSVLRQVLRYPAGSAEIRRNLVMLVGAVILSTAPEPVWSATVTDLAAILVVLGISYIAAFAPPPRTSPAAATSDEPSGDATLRSPQAAGVTSTRRTFLLASIIGGLWFALAPIAPATAGTCLGGELCEEHVGEPCGASCPCCPGLYCVGGTCRTQAGTQMLCKQNGFPPAPCANALVCPPACPLFCSCV